MKLNCVVSMLQLNCVVSRLKLNCVVSMLKLNCVVSMLKLGGSLSMVVCCCLGCLRATVVSLLALCASTYVEVVCV